MDEPKTRRVRVTADDARRAREATRMLVVAHGALGETRRPCGTQLSTPHAYALLELGRDQSLTVAELALRLNVDRSNVSRLASRMEKDGELVRLPHPTDGRARLLRLTEKGQRIAAQVDSVSAAHFERVVDALGLDLEETLLSVRRLTDALTRTSILPSYEEP